MDAGALVIRVPGRFERGAVSARPSTRARSVGPWRRECPPAAGTAEARRLAAAVGARRGIALTSSLAGAVAVPLLPGGRRADRRASAASRGSPAGCATTAPTRWSTPRHPFATRMTDDAVAAAAALRLPLLVLRRPGWTAGPGDHWHRVPDMAAAAALAPRAGRARVPRDRARRASPPSPTRRAGSCCARVDRPAADRCPPGTASSATRARSPRTPSARCCASTGSRWWSAGTAAATSPPPSSSRPGSWACPS